MSLALSGRSGFDPRPRTAIEHDHAQRNSHKTWSATKRPSRLSRTRRPSSSRYPRAVNRSIVSAGEGIELEAGPSQKVVAFDAGLRSAQHQDRGLARLASADSSSLGPVAGKPASIRRRYAFNSRVLTERTPRR